jgi:hypothetical protein
MSNTIQSNAIASASKSTVEYALSTSTVAENEEGKSKVPMQLDSYENAIEIDCFNNYSENGVIANEIAMEHIEETADSFVKEKSPLDAAFEKLMQNQAFLNSNHLKISWNIAGQFAEDLPDDFRDDFIEFCNQYIKQADQETVKLYFQKAMLTYNYGINEDSKPGWKEAGFSSAKEIFLDYDIDDILENGSEGAKRVLRHGVCMMLLDKSKSSEGLTEQERMFSPWAARVEICIGPNGSFESRMAKTADDVKSYMTKTQQSISDERTFSIKFDKDFNFVVSSNNDEESNILQNALSSSKRILENAVWAILYHRQDDGSVNPWLSDDSIMSDVAKEYGYAKFSNEFTGLMKLFESSYEVAQMNGNLSRLFDVTMDDMEYIGGKLSGKTPEAQEAIDSELFYRMDYEKHVKRLINKETTDDLSFISMEYTNGKFSLIY